MDWLATIAESICNLMSSEVPEMSQPDTDSQDSAELRKNDIANPLGVRDDFAYWLPMLVFIALTVVGDKWRTLYPATYLTKTIVVALLLCLFWRHYTSIRWSHSWLGVLTGIVGVFQWVGMQLWLQENFEFFRPAGEAFDPSSFFSNSGLLYAFLAVRIAGAVLLVPIMEELFWRDFLWRTMIGPNDFRKVRVGKWDTQAVAIVCVAFACVHGHCWLTAVVWAAMIAWLLVQTGSLGACIIAHAVTNLLLAMYVLWTKDWAFW